MGASNVEIAQQLALLQQSMDRLGSEFRRLDRLDDMRDRLRDLDRESAKADQVARLAEESKQMHDRLIELEARIEKGKQHALDDSALQPLTNSIEELRKRIPPIVQTSGAVIAALIALGYAGFKLESLNKPVEAAAKNVNQSATELTQSLGSLNEAKTHLQQVIEESVNGLQPRLDTLTSQFETQSEYLRDLDQMMTKVASQAALMNLELKGVRDGQSIDQSALPGDPRQALLEMIGELGVDNPYIAGFTEVSLAIAAGRYSEARAKAELMLAKTRETDERIGLSLLIAESWDYEGDFERAIEQYDELLQIPEAADWRAKLLNGRAGSKMKRAFDDGTGEEEKKALLASASEDFAGAFSLKPGNVPLAHNYALCLNERNEFEEALSVIQSLDDLEDADVFYQQAVAYAGLGQHTLAVHALGEASTRSRALALRAAADPAFTALRGDEGFLSLLRVRLGPELMSATKQTWATMKD